jgi:hypothetical protein
MIEPRRWKKACENAAGGPREHRAIPLRYPKKGEVGRGAPALSGAATLGALQAPSVAASPLI